MSDRVKALELENQKLRAASQKTIRVEDLDATNAEVATLKKQNADTNWAEKIKWQGDFRYRYENIKEEDSKNRHRHRISARPGLVAKTSPTTEMGFGLATGGDNPVSTMQTLGDGGTKKDIDLDLAYLKWNAFENTFVNAGKFANPFFAVQKSQLIWDSDYRPEGGAINWTDQTFFANAGYSFIESDSAVGAYGISAAQFGANFKPFDDTTLTAAVAYYDIPTKGEEPSYNDDFFGNASVVKNGVEVYEFNHQLVNASLNVGINAFDLPLYLYADYVENQDVNNLETGYMLGIQLGNSKNKGTWHVLYQYEDLEANATLGLITASDFGGGGTDVKGSTFAARYAIDNQWFVGTTYYFDNKTGVALGDNENYDRIQLDTGFTY
ncbi:MAG TPA: putative porin [Halioglobus sp.]